MARIIVSGSNISGSAGVGRSSEFTISFVVKDHPANFDRHFRLMSMLAKAEIILSDDSGEFEIQIKEPAKVP